MSIKSIANKIAREDIRARLKRIAKPGDVKCQQCGRMRSLDEACWWCGDPAQTSEQKQTVGKHIIKKWSYKAEGRDFAYLIGEQTSEAADDDFTSIVVYVHEDVNVNNPLDTIWSYSDDGTAIRIDPTSYGTDFDDWYDKMSKDKLAGKNWELAGNDAYEYYDTYQDYIDKYNVIQSQLDLLDN